MNDQDLATFDEDFALNQFSGNQSLLIQILKKFISQNEDFKTELQASLQQNDLETAKRQVHTLKGVTGNLGMKALHHACKDVENRIEQNPSFDDLTEFLKLIDITMLAAQNYGVVKEPEATPTPPASTSNSDKEQLISALKRNEFLSDAKLDQYINGAQLSPEDSQKLKKHIDDFDYVNAIAMLN